MEDKGGHTAERNEQPMSSENLRLFCLLCLFFLLGFSSVKLLYPQLKHRQICWWK